MHDEVLTDTAARLLPELHRFRGFYLAGGTALALQIGHRRSVDFDLFTEDSLSERLLQDVKRIFDGRRISVIYRSPEQLDCIVDEVKMTFLSFTYPVIESFAEYKQLPLASVREIAAMKAFAIGKRLSYKDYVDWYFVLKEGHAELSDIIAVAKEKFGGDFNDRLFLGQLVSLDDISVSEIDVLRGEVSKNEIASFFMKKVKELDLLTG